MNKKEHDTIGQLISTARDLWRTKRYDRLNDIIKQIMKKL